MARPRLKIHKLVSSLVGPQLKNHKLVISWPDPPGCEQFSFLALRVLDLEHLKDLGGLVFLWTPFTQGKRVYEMLFLTF